MWLEGFGHMMAVGHMIAGGHMMTVGHMMAVDDEVVVRVALKVSIQVLTFGVNSNL